MDESGSSRSERPYVILSTAEEEPEDPLFCLLPVSGKKAFVAAISALEKLATEHGAGHARRGSDTMSDKVIVFRAHDWYLESPGNDRLKNGWVECPYHHLTFGAV